MNNHWGICSQCASHLTNSTLNCDVCGLPKQAHATHCDYCRKIKPNWHHLIAVADYQPPLSYLIKQFKSKHKTELGYAFAHLMLMAWLRQRWQAKVARPDIITCIPLHRQRYWYRGYNQSELLAKPMAHWIGGRYEPYLLTRTMSKQQQKRLSKRERIDNIHHAFRCNKPLHNQKIVLIDDVVTTGSTIKEACRVLTSQGAAHIQIICLCRTGL